MKRITKESIIAGIIAVVAFVSIVCELIFGGISTASVAAAIKDTAGIFVDIMVFFIACKAFVKRGGFRGRLEVAMEEIEKSYAPLVREHKASETNESDYQKNQEFIRYDLAKNVDALFGVECKDYMRFFEIKAQSPDRITFFVRKKFFGEPFDPGKIATRIKGFCEKKYKNFAATYALDKDGANITVSFGHVLRTKEDVESLISVIDDVLFLYIAEYKKQ